MLAPQKHPMRPHNWLPTRVFEFFGNVALVSHFFYPSSYVYTIRLRYSGSVMVPLFDPYAGRCTLVSTTERKGLFGMPYCNEGWHTKQVSDKRQFQRTDCCHPPCKGSRAVRPLHFSDELCHLQARFERYYPPAGSAPTTSCCCTASTSYPSKTSPKDDIIGTTASVDVSHTYTTCHASSTSLPIGQSRRHSYSSTQEPRPFARPALRRIRTALAAM